MVQITKNGNVTVILFTDSDYYLFDSGQIIVPLGSLTMVLDKSDMVTFRKAANNDLLFSAKISKVRINGTALTKQNAQTLFDDAMGGSQGSGLRFEQVQTLPQTGENGVIYLVPNGDDTFTEWVWIENEERFEEFGYDMDLSNYYTKTQVDTMFGGLETELDNYYTKDEVDDANLTISAALNELHEEKQDVLSFDSAPTLGSDNAVTSNGIKEAVDTVQWNLNTAIAGLEEHYQPLLDFDTQPTANSDNPVTSGGLATYLGNNYYNTQEVDMEFLKYYTKDEIDEGNQVVATALNRLNNAVNAIDLSDYATTTAMNTALASKQNTLTFDSTPTANSTNPVTSGGVYTVLGDISTALQTIIGNNS